MEGGKVAGPVQFNQEEIKIKSYTADSFVNYDILEKKFANEVNEFLNDKINLLDVNKTYEKFMAI